MIAEFIEEDRDNLVKKFDMRESYHKNKELWKEFLRERREEIANELTDWTISRKKITSLRIELEILNNLEDFVLEYFRQAIGLTKEDSKC